MNWSALTFDWNRARALLATAEEGSLSAAARALGLTQPTVGRQVAALEGELGVVLFERVGKRLQLTPAGLEVVEQVRAMAEAATRVSLVATGRSEHVAGLVRVTASQLISAHLLAPALQRLRRDHPGITVEIVASNTVSDLLRREADLAVRNVAPSEPELVARRLPDRAAWLYATPAYLQTLGDPDALELADLARAELLGFRDVGRMLQGLRAMGLPLTAESFPVLTDDHLVQWELCKAGLGICVVMEDVGEAEPRVRRVLPDHPPIPIPMYLVSHRAVRTSRRLRIVAEALAEALGAGD